MTFEEAARDPKRPLSLTPREWMYSVESHLAELDEATTQTARRIASESPQAYPKGGETGLEKVDMGLDMLVQGCNLIDAGLADGEEADLLPRQRQAMRRLRELLETAVVPYVSDMVGLSDSLDGEA